MPDHIAPSRRSINLPDVLWTRVRARAHREGWPVRAALLQLLGEYAEGRLDLQGLPPVTRRGPNSDVESGKRMMEPHLKHLAESSGLQVQVQWDDDSSEPVTRMLVSVLERERPTRTHAVSMTIVELEDVLWDDAARHELQQRVRVWFASEVVRRTLEVSRRGEGVELTAVVDLGRIFRETTAAYNQGGIFAGRGAMEAWAEVFRRMRTRLDVEGAPDEQRAAFQEAILLGIDVAPDSGLNPDERLALRNAVLTAFDDIPRSYNICLAPKAQFLGYVRWA